MCGSDPPARRRHLPGILVGALVGSLTAAPAAAQMAAPSGPADVTISAPFSSHWIHAGDGIELDLSQPVASGAGRLAILIAETDWTSLFEADGRTLRYRSGGLPLPTGESQLTVFLVTPGGDWQQVAQFPLRVLTAGGFEQASAQPALDVSSQGRVALHRQPETPGERRRYQDVTVHVGLLSKLVRSGWTTTGQANFIGVTRQEDALRFDVSGQAAPQFDLSDYLVGVEHRRLRLSLGHVEWDGERHLVSQFATRGVAADVGLGPAVDVAFHAMNGTSIVGWSNFFGLDRREHQVVGATLGLEFVPARPGEARFTASILDGSLLPLNGFTEGLVNDTEKSRGTALRFTAGDPGQRLQLDAGYSRSRFTNPQDPLLDQGTDVVPVRETTRQARYLDVSYALWQGPAGASQIPVSLVAAFRHSRVDPLYRSVAAAVQADRLENTVELTTGVGQVTSQISWTGFHDNLDNLSSLMTTTTRGVTWTSAVPLASFADEPAPWLPTVNYALNWTHQSGDGLPPNSLFNSASHVPDQVSTNQLLGVEWTAANWHASYQWNRSYQDNRQPGRELADFRTLVHTVGVSVTPRPSFDLGIDLSFETADNLGASTADLTHRIGFTGAWRPAGRTSFSGVITRTLTDDTPRTHEGRVVDFNLQFTQGIAFLRRHPDRLQGQLFVRLVRQTTTTADVVFGLDDHQHFWMVNTGLTFQVF